jgi:hypothetical protein
MLSRLIALALLSERAWYCRCVAVAAAGAAAPLQNPRVRRTLAAGRDGEICDVSAVAKDLRLAMGLR